MSSFLLFLGNQPEFELSKLPPVFLTHIRSLQCERDHLRVTDLVIRTNHAVTQIYNLCASDGAREIKSKKCRSLVFVYFERKEGNFASSRAEQTSRVKRWWHVFWDAWLNFSSSLSAKLDGVKTYMRLRRVPNGIQNKVIKWFDYLWLTQKSSDEERAISCLPGEIVQNLTMTHFPIWLTNYFRVKTEKGFY